MKFPPEFNEKVDLKKVKFDLIKSWIAKRIGELLGFEDDVVINFVISSLEAEVMRNLHSHSLLTFLVRLHQSTTHSRMLCIRDLTYWCYDVSECD
jgi:hypothetical protein